MAPAPEKRRAYSEMTYASPSAPMPPSSTESGVLKPATPATRPSSAPAEKIGPMASVWPIACSVVSFRSPS